MDTQRIITEKLDLKPCFPDTSNNEYGQQSGLATFTALLNQQTPRANKNNREAANSHHIPEPLQPTLATIQLAVHKAEPTKPRKKHSQRQK